jgi:hypothetical protein
MADWSYRVRAGSSPAELEREIETLAKKGWEPMLASGAILATQSGTVYVFFKRERRAEDEAEDAAVKETNVFVTSLAAKAQQEIAADANDHKFKPY